MRRWARQNAGIRWTRWTTKRLRSRSGVERACDLAIDLCDALTRRDGAAGAVDCVPRTKTDWMIAISHCHPAVRRVEIYTYAADATAAVPLLLLLLLLLLFQLYIHLHLLLRRRHHIPPYAEQPAGRTIVAVPRSPVFVDVWTAHL